MISNWKPDINLKLSAKYSAPRRRPITRPIFFAFPGVASQPQKNPSEIEKSSTILSEWDLKYIRINKCSIYPTQKGYLNIRPAKRGRDVCRSTSALPPLWTEIHAHFYVIRHVFHFEINRFRAFTSGCGVAEECSSVSWDGIWICSFITLHQRLYVFWKWVNKESSSTKISKIQHLTENAKILIIFRIYTRRSWNIGGHLL